MKIKTRLTIANAAMILISLVVLLVICGLVLNSFERQYYRADNMMLDSNSGNVQTILENADENSDCKKLGDRVALYDYRLYVFKNGRLIYSNGVYDISVEHMLNAPDWQDGKSRCMVMDGATVVGVKNGSTMFIAVNGAVHGTSDKRLPDRRTEIGNFLIAFVIIGIASILVIFIASRLYSHRMIKRVMLPIDLLSSASDRVLRGDYTQQIRYENSDEFTTVINSFNQMQSHLLHEQEKAYRYEKSRTDMIAGISHDLRTPLTSIKGYIKGISDGIADTAEKQKRYLDTAYKKSCEMEKLLDKLFYFSKLQSGNLPMDMQSLDLNEFLGDFVNDINLSKSLKAEFISDDLPHFIFGDREQLTRVFANLADNAVKYSGSDNLRITVKLVCENDRETVYFSDNGKGVPDIMLDSIFECFFRCSEARRPKDAEDSGLGLYIVKYLIEAHGGSVCAESENGLTVKLSFPREANYEQNTDS